MSAVRELALPDVSDDVERDPDRGLKETQVSESSAREGDNEGGTDMMGAARKILKKS